MRGGLGMSIVLSLRRTGFEQLDWLEMGQSLTKTQAIVAMKCGAESIKQPFGAFSVDKRYRRKVPHPSAFVISTFP